MSTQSDKVKNKPKDGDSDSASEDHLSEEDNDASSSEIDEEEGERRKAIIMNDLTQLEKQFVELREQLYLARKERITTKLEEVKSGKAPEYLQPLEDLQDQMRIRTEVAGILKELRMKNIRCKFDAEQQAARQTYEAERRLIISDVKSDIEDRLRRLDEDKKSLELHNTETKMETYENIRDHLYIPDKRRRPVSIAGPYIIYMLRDHEILEDHAMIRRALV